MFIKRTFNYSVKHLKTGAARVYIPNEKNLAASSFVAGTAFDADYIQDEIICTPNINGALKVLDTGRGAILELRNKKTAISLGNVDNVTVTFDKCRIRISVKSKDIKQVSRIKRLRTRIMNNRPLETASLYSGTGALALAIKEGLSSAGIKTSIAFANDISEIALTCSLEGNPIWDDASKLAIAVADTIENINLNDIKEVDFVEIGYPCVAFSKLASKEKRDLKHPDTGCLFIPMIPILKKMNPAYILIENTPDFIHSATFELIKRSFPDYNFKEAVVNGLDFDELEGRKRACIIAITKGIPEFDFNLVQFNQSPIKPVLGDILEDIPLTSPLWKKFEHVIKKDKDISLGFKHSKFTPIATKITTLTARYHAAKIGTPFIAHNTDHELQRQFTVLEHGRLRKLPDRLINVILSIADGTHQLVSKRGNKTIAHRLLGNGCSRNVFYSVGKGIAEHMKQLVPQQSLCF
jgi:DNA (cytosine-5)-methyltransferase 1